MKEGDIRAAPREPFDLFDFRRRIDVETANGYRDLRRSLTPDFVRVRRDIAFGYAALAAVLLCVSLATGLMARLGAAALGAIAVGYGVAYLQLFIHEAAHFNLAANRAANDRLANALICWQVGTDVAAYRRTHAEHHRHLGKKGDTEVSYAKPLTLRFLVDMVTGIHALRVFLDRRGRRGLVARTTTSSAPLVRGAAVHLILIAVLLGLGAWPAALAWVGGVGVAFPVFATVRQILEHRPSARVADIAGGEGEGAVTRLFDDGFFARTFGGAGFNRHLLHHLEPQISYTRLAELEDFLMNTSARDALEARRATYFGAFRELWTDDRRR
jgi:fatty acid desaturase